MGTTSLQTFIDGKQVKEPKGWQDMTVFSAYGSDSIKPQVEADRLEFFADGNQKISEHKDNGNIFEPLPLKMVFKQRGLDSTVLDGNIDLSQDYEQTFPKPYPLSSVVSFVQDDSITNFLDKIKGVTYGSLVEEGIITKNDYVTIKTAIIKKANFLDVAISLVTIYLIQKQIQDTIAEIKKTVATITSLIASGGLTGSIGGVIFSVASLLIQVAYAVAMVALLFTLVTSIITLLLPPILKNKGMSYRKLLEKGCEKFGYTFESNINELDIYHILPSKPYDNSKNLLKDLVPQLIPNKIGIPSTGDQGYLINEFFDLMKSMFDVRFDVSNGVVKMYNSQDNYWKTLSKFKPRKSILLPSKRFNTADLKQTRMMSFTTDLNDDWTVENYTGTSYEIKTETTSGTTGAIKGLERIDINHCLPSTKTKLGVIEFLMVELAQIADAFAKIIGQNTKFAETIEKNKINILKVSSNDWSKPKVVPLVNGNIPKNHRDILSARYLMHTFHYGKSFVTDGRKGQKVYFENIEIPFTLSDFKETLKNGKFTLLDGTEAEFETLEYNFSSDKATASFFIEEVYTTKLKEIYYEP